MVFNRKSRKEQASTDIPSEPVTVGEVIDELVDPERQEIKQDSEAEQARKKVVLERLTNILDQVKEDRKKEIELAQADEERDPEVMQKLGEEVIEIMAVREELNQQVREAEAKQLPDEPEQP